MKNYPPSEAKLRKLRRSGQLAKSKDFTTAALFLGAGCGGIFLGAAWDHSSFILEGEAKEQFTQAFTLLISLSFRLLAPIVVAVALAEAYQTRFLFAFQPLIPRLNRVFAFSENLFSPEFSRTLRSAAALVKASLWLLIATGVVLIGFREFHPSSTLPLVEQISDLAFPVLLVALGFSFFFGVLSRFVAVLHFRRQHQMSRAEVDAEYREMEGSAEHRTRMRHLTQE